MSDNYGQITAVVRGWGSRSGGGAGHVDNKLISTVQVSFNVLIPKNAKSYY